MYYDMMPYDIIGDDWALGYSNKKYFFQENIIFKHSVEDFLVTFHILIGLTCYAINVRLNFTAYKITLIWKFT